MSRTLIGNIKNLNDSQMRNEIEYGDNYVGENINHGNVKGERKNHML